MQRILIIEGSDTKGDATGTKAGNKIFLETKRAIAANKKIAINTGFG